MDWWIGGGAEQLKVLSRSPGPPKTIDTLEDWWIGGCWWIGGLVVGGLVAWWIGGLEDWRIGGLEDWKIGGVGPVLARTTCEDVGG